MVEERFHNQLAHSIYLRMCKFIAENIESLAEEGKSIARSFNLKSSSTVDLIESVKNIAIVSHGTALRCFLKKVLKTKENQFVLSNTSVTELLWHPKNGWTGVQPID